MTNYYEEFSIPQGASLDEIKQILIKERKKWNLRQNAADLSKRQNAENKLKMLDEAADVFQDSYSKDSYDIKLKKGGKGSTQSTQEKVDTSIPTGEENVEVLIERIKNIYETGNNATVIDLCNKLLNAGNTDPRIYDYLCSAYEESEKYDLALANARTALKVTNDAWFKYLVAKYDVYYFNNLSEANSLINDILNSNVNKSYALSLLVEIDLLSGNETKADISIEEYLTNNPNDEDYKQKVASAFLKYSDIFLTTAPDGFMVWKTKDDYVNSLNARKKAYDIYPCDATKETYYTALNYNKKQFDKEDLAGPIVMALLGLDFFLISFSAFPKTIGMTILGLLVLAFSGWIFYSKVGTTWTNERDSHLNVRPLPKHIARITTNILKIIGKIYLWVLRLFISIIAGM